MKNLIIYVDSLKRDGAERVSVNLSKYMTQQGVSCMLLTEWISENEYPVPDGVRRVSIGVHGNKYVHYMQNVIKMRKILKQSSADTLLVMDLPGCLLAIPAAFGLKMKVVVSERNDPTHFPGKQIVAKVSRWLMSKADGFVFQTSGAKSFYKNITNNRGVIIPNPLFIDDLPQPFNGERKKAIVTAGRLTAQKNQKLLIEAYNEVQKRHPDYKLIIYGEGALRQTLTDQIKELNISEKVQMPGNKLDLLQRMKDSALFVMSSDFEGMPNALLEAMAIGLPCVSTDCPCGGPRAVIESGKNGLLVPVGNAEELEAAIEEMITDTEMADKMANEATKIRITLDSNNICKQWKDYLDIL